MPGSDKVRLGILVGPRGRGSNMVAIARACSEGRLHAEVAVVISPVEDSPAAADARAMGIAVDVVPPGESYGEALRASLGRVGAEVVCLAGFLRLLPSEVLAEYPQRVLNIHPALLPDFGGQGMYGRRVHEAVLASGRRESGCTVHLVDEKYDEGRILIQRRCPVQSDDTPESLAARVLVEEHTAYVEALQEVIRGIRSGVG